MIRLSDLALLQGRPARDSGGEPAGTVDRIYLSDVDREPRWVTLTSTDAPAVFAPLAGAETDEDGLRLAVTRHQLLSSPRVPADEHLAPEEEAALAGHYELELDGAPDPGERDDVTVTLTGERVVPRTEVVTRQLRLRRYVVTEVETVEVPLKRERLAIERLSADGGEAELLEELTLREERVASVQTETFLVHDVQLTRDVVVEDQQVTADVAREHLEIDADTDVPPR